MSFCVGVKLFFSGDGFADPSPCCKAGFRPARASCLIRAKYWYSQATQSCKNEFLRCCFNATGEKGNVIKMYENLKVVCRQTIFSFIALQIRWCKIIQRTWSTNKTKSMMGLWLSRSLVDDVQRKDASVQKSKILWRRGSKGIKHRNNDLKF